MRKIFLITTFVLSLLAATAFAAENDSSVEGFDYTSQVYGFKIKCPVKPIVILNPFEDPKARGELLVLEVTPDGQDIAYGYQILLDAFDTKSVPNFNKDREKTIDDYIKKLAEANKYEYVSLENISKDNKGILAMTAKKLEIRNDKGEVEDVLVADKQSAFAFFRTRSGRCISIQLITTEMSKENIADYLKSVSTYQDATDLSMPDKKSKK